MIPVNRREALRLAAGMTAGVGVLGVGVSQAAGADAADTQPGVAHDDPQLAQALANPQSFMFIEQIAFETPTTGPRTQFLAIGPCRGAPHGDVDTEVPLGSMRIFRADAERDDFTRQGGLYWRCGDERGTVKFERPGPLVMVVRERDGSVRCYALMLDLRC